MDQHNTPLFDAIKAHRNRDVTPFYVPGHKHGNGLPELVEFLGETVFQIDLNAMPEVDDLANPVSCIRESEALLADAFEADHAFMLTNGTTCGVQAMLLATTRPGDKIIIPRDAHKSAINALILSGAIPHYVHTDINQEYGIHTTVSLDSFKSAYDKEPHALACFIINPSYYGLTSYIKGLADFCHENELFLLADEAHGCHMGFHPDFPLPAMRAGAHISASSTHKTSGSFTQSSILLHRGSDLVRNNIKQSLNILRSTSASYLLMLSIEMARKQLVINGKKMLSKTLDLVRHARTEVNKIPGLKSFGREIIETSAAIQNFDETKLTINVAELGLTGYEMEEILRLEHRIQIELADLQNIMAIISIGDTEESIQNLLNALAKISKGRRIKKPDHPIILPEIPELIVSPRDAFYSAKKSVSLNKAIGEISAENVMVYPPGIPIICPGERISKDLIDHIKLLKSLNTNIQGPADPQINHLRVLGNA